MKVIKYKLCTTINYGTIEDPLFENVFSNIERGWNEANEEIAKQEAYNGEYEIFDEDIEEIPSWQDKIEAQVTYNSMMLGTLIEEV